MTGEKMHVAFIASREFLDGWDWRATSAGGLVIFVDADSPSVIDTILRQHPEVVVLDSRFASTVRAATLIAQLFARPELSAVEIRVLASERTPASFAHTSGTALAATLVASAHPASKATLMDRYRICDEDRLSRPLGQRRQHY